MKNRSLQNIYKPLSYMFSSVAVSDSGWLQSNLLTHCCPKLTWYILICSISHFGTQQLEFRKLMY